MYMSECLIINTYLFILSRSCRGAIRLEMSTIALSMTVGQVNVEWISDISRLMTYNVSDLLPSSNLGTGFTRECLRFRENFAQCRATQQPSTDYLQVKLCTGGSWSSCCQDAL
jgi:hypothetical protein